MGNEIPTKQRSQVNVRDNGQCLRCGGRGTEVHHRRRRRERSHFQHCPCNMVRLCATCHPYLHSHKGRAQGQREGFMLASTISDPYNHPVQAWSGRIYLTCDGTTNNEGITT